MARLRFEQVGELRKLIAESARTDGNNAEAVSERFVEISVGLTQKLEAKRHHLLTGRRGTGKSTHLHYSRRKLQNAGTPAPIIDMEVFKDREYPDVLIEIVLEIFKAIRPGRSVIPSIIKRRRRLLRLEKKLRSALRDPAVFSNSKVESHGRKRGGAIGIGARADSHWIGANTNAESSNQSSSAFTRTAEFETSKLEGLNEQIGDISRVFSDLVAHSKTKTALLFLDDFYFVSLDDQAAVLDFLHRACKGTGVWLKVGAVGTRVRPFKDGDPPIGMQPSQDIDALAIDVTLGDFGTAKRFLEAVLDGILKPLGVSTQDLFANVARDRMVLACGGAVARDYITLTEAALDEAIERLTKRGETSEATEIRVHSEDVHRAISERISDKESDSIRQDAGEDASALNRRWRDICDFAKSRNDSAFVLIELTRLETEEWGSEVLQLESLRLLHRVGEATPNTDAWRGKRAAVYMIDLGQVASQRLTAEIPQFWNGQKEFDKLRRAHWVYEPRWDESHESSVELR